MATVAQFVSSYLTAAHVLEKKLWVSDHCLVCVADRAFGFVVGYPTSPSVEHPSSL